MREEHFLESQLVVAAVNRGAPIRRVLAKLQDHWGVPRVDALRKSGDEDRAKPGNHGIPEIGRQEKAFFDSLTDGQRDAYHGIKSTIETLFDENKGWQGFDPWKIGEPIDEWKSKAFAALASNPLQAFMVGQMLASEALKNPINRPLMPTDREAIEFLEHYTFNEINDAFEGLKTDLRQKLITGMQQGDNPKEVARALKNALDDYETDWGLIAITETARADAQGRLLELNDAGEKWAVGSSAHDSRVCESCLELIDGKVIKIADTIGVSNYGRKRDAWLPVIPLHPRCRCVWLPATDDVIAMLREARKNANG